MKIKSNTSLSLRKFLLSALVAAPLATLPAPLWALPQTSSANVTSSSATTTFTPTATVLSITDTTATRLVLRWVNFGSGASSIGAGETVIWNLPSSTSAVLNTVSTGGTLVDGTLQSNGTIFILNPNGIILGNTANVTAAGLGLSTIGESEFFFVNNGNLSYTGASAPTADVQVNLTGANAINVGTTGSVFIAGRASDVSGTINAGTLNISSTNATTGVRLGQAGALTLGVRGTPATLIDPAIPGTGNLVVTTGGGAAVLSSGGVTSILGGNATITTSGGAVTQGAGLFSVGDAVSNSNLTLNTYAGAGTGAVTLGALAANGQRNNVTLNSGVTSITTNQGTTTSLGGSSVTSGRVAIGGTVTGTGAGVALAVVAGGSSIDSLSDTTVTGGSIALTTLGNNSGITFRGPGDLTFSTLATAATTGSGVTLTSTTGAIVLPAATIGGNLTVTAQTNITQTGAIINTQAGTDASTTRVASFDAVTGGITLTTGTNNFTRLVLKNAPTGASVVDTNDVVLGNGTNVTGAAVISTNAGNIIVGAAAADTVRFGSTLTLNAGAAAAATATVTNGGTGYSATPVVTISAPNSPGGTQATATATVAGGVITGITVTGGSGYTTAPSVTITDATGTGAAATLAVGGASTITDGTDNFTVTGGLTLLAGGAITLNGAASNSIGLNHQFGQVNATSLGAVTLYESSTLNLGTINAASLRAYGVAGLIQTGRLNITGASAFGAGTGAAPGDISLTYSAGAGAGNVLAGTISILDDFALLSNGAPNGAPTGSYLARNFTVVNEAATTIGALSGTADNGLTGNLTVTAVGGTNGITLGRTVVGGDVTLTAPGAVTASNTNNRISRVTVTAGGNVDFRTQSNVTVNAALTQATAGATASFQSNGGALTIGAFNSDYTGTVRFTTTANSRAITDSVNGVRVFGPVRFSSDGGVTINRAGHSFGGVTISTANNGSATIVESGGLRLVDVNINGSGSFTATSTTGDVLQDGTASVGIRFGNGNSSATFNAPLGRVLLTDSVNNSMAGRINATAAGDIVIGQQRRNVILGNITSSGGKLTVDKSSPGLFVGVNFSLATGGAGYTVAPTVTISAPTGANGVQAVATATIDTVATSATVGQVTGITFTNPGSGYITAPTVALTGGTFTTAATLNTLPGDIAVTNNSDITQFAGARINVLDTVTLRVSGAGVITIGNTGNRMGGIVASSNTGTITLTEDTTLNLKSISTAGNLVATSSLSNIIDSTDVNVITAGSATSLATTNNVVVGGTATFAAPMGNVTLTLGTSNYNIVGFTASGNVALTDGVLNTTLTNSVIGGTLDVSNTVATGTINQNGPVKANGATTFSTGTTGTIDLGNSGNEFGGLRFTGSTVAITENTTMNLRGGSIATGPAILNTNANFITSGSGGSSFLSSLTINAPNGSITPSANSLTVVGTFTVFSNVLKDLGALSKSGNLFNRDPINLGTGTYNPPIN